LNDQYAPAAKYLAHARLHRDPAHITYSVDPAISFPKLRLVANHAYWLSGLKTRKAGSNGTIDAFSHGSGTRDPVPSGTKHGTGVLKGGLIPAIGYVRQYQTWGPARQAPTADLLDIKATNLSSVTIDPARA